MPKTSFEDGNISLGIPGTIVTAAFLNAVNNHRHMGTAVDGDGALDYAVTTGSADAYLLALTPALSAYAPGMPFYFKASFTNSGPATMAINSLAAVALKKNINDSLIAGDIVTGRIYLGMYDGTNIIVLNVVPSGFSKSNYPYNYSLAASVASNTLTISRKGEDGNDPSATNVAEIPFRNPTLTIGTPLRMSYTTAANIILPQGSTLGFLANESGRFYVYEGTDGTNKDMGVARTSFVPEDGLFSSTAISAAATSAKVLYSISGRSNWVWRLVGYLEATMGATLGNWASIQKVQVMGPGINRTGDVVREYYTETNTTIQCTTIIPHDNTTPQITEGDPVLSISDVTFLSLCNKIEYILNIDAVGCGVTNHLAIAALFSSLSTSALASRILGYNNAGSWLMGTAGERTIPVNSLSLQTISVRIGPEASTTIEINSWTSTTRLNGSCVLSLKMKEVFA